MTSRKDDYIAKLTFVPFKYEEAPPYKDAGYLRPSEETQARVQDGAVLKLKDGSIYLVGDCNAILGVCDDCREFDYKDIAEIAYLWDAEPETPQAPWEDNLRAELARRENEGK